jgi:hypothetical protein
MKISSLNDKRQIILTYKVQILKPTRTLYYLQHGENLW